MTRHSLCWISMMRYQELHSNVQVRTRTYRISQSKLRLDPDLFRSSFHTFSVYWSAPKLRNSTIRIECSGNSRRCVCTYGPKDADWSRSSTLDAFYSKSERKVLHEVIFWTNLKSDVCQLRGAHRERWPFSVVLLVPRSIECVNLILRVKSHGYQRLQRNILAVNLYFIRNSTENWILLKVLWKNSRAIVASLLL